jgi:transmembrane sensor
VYYAGIHQKVLSDGSTVELTTGTRIELDFTPEHRRVRLLNGQAHFAVTKNASRPFIVTAAGVDVRAVGTAFAVKVGAENVEVVVTEGRVAVGSQPVLAAPDNDLRPVAYLDAGNSAIVPVPGEAQAAAIPTVVTLSPGELQEQTAWRAPRLRFTDISLAQAVALFNERNALRIEIGDAVVSAQRLNGDFRSDNIEGFVSLLELNFGIRAERRSDRIVLFRAR